MSFARSKLVTIVKRKAVPRQNMRKSGRTSAAGTVFAWQTLGYDVDDITAATRGLIDSLLAISDR
jgi:hypothetical protein